MEFDKEIKSKALLDEFVICHFSDGPFYLKSDGYFTANFQGKDVLRFTYEPDAQLVCQDKNAQFAEEGHELAGKVRVCRTALQVQPLRDVAGDDVPHFTPRKKPSKICPAHFEEVSPEDLMDDFEPPSSDQTKEFKEN